METPEVTEVWEFYRDNCPGFKEPMRKQLRKVDSHMAELESQNAKLREQGERLFDKTLELGTENARLRELINVMAYCMQYERECDECRMNGADGTITAPVGCDGLRDRMRELGVEV